MKYDAVIFDLFGTLVDNTEFLDLSRSEYNRTLSNVAAALSIPEPDLLRLWSETVHERDAGLFPSMEKYFRHICREIGVKADARQIANAVELRLEYLRSVLTPRNHTVETLTELKASGYRLGLISDCSSEVPLLWPETPFAALLDGAIFSCEVKLTKPDPRIYRMVCDSLKVAPGKCLYVGDGGSGELTGAVEFGMDPVLIRAPYDTVNGHREDWEGTRISELKQVLDLVRGQPSI
ncbi:MAG: HAD family hydrolase [Dehalococcoidia bacterium]|jgi:putative hydrolase of the HAD superfamily|nr:HAD family hydrolase [Dehalococcoidia bacterium]